MFSFIKNVYILFLIFFSLLYKTKTLAVNSNVKKKRRDINEKSNKIIIFCNREYYTINNRKNFAAIVSWILTLFFINGPSEWLVYVIACDVVSGSAFDCDPWGKLLSRPEWGKYYYKEFVLMFCGTCLPVSPKVRQHYHQAAWGPKNQPRNQYPLRHQEHWHSY